MRKFSIVLVLVGVIGVGILLGWLGSGSRSRSPVSGDASTSPASLRSTQTTAAVPPSDGHGESSRPEPGRRPVGENPAPKETGSAPAGDLITNWEDKVDQILTSDGPESDKAKEMLEMFPKLSPEGQVEVAQHLSNLLPDEDYPSLGKFLTDAKLPEDVLDELMADILNRPNSLKLPYLLDVAKQPQHPKASEAKDLLELFLEEDYATDWAKWQTKMQEWLKENPD